MLGEIDKYFYCSANFTDDPQDCPILYDGEKCEDCQCYHRKHPTPEQYKEEYGEEWKGAIYCHCTSDGCDTDCKYKEWGEVEEFGCLNDYSVICACTPFGKPSNGWRPK
jgi:hypothetical protein